MEGWIKIHRKIIEWEWYDDPHTFGLFIHCLILANWEDKKWHGIDIPRGSFISSYPHLAEDTGMTVRNVRTAINHLKTTGELTVQTTNRYSIITVVGYDKYQVMEIQPTRKPTGKPTDSGQTADRQTTTTKELKNIRTKEENIYSEDFESFWKVYPKKKGKGSAYKNRLIAIKTADPKKIIDGATKYAAECKHLKTEDGFIKRPQGWISDGRWDDEYNTLEINKEKALEDWRKKRDAKETFTGSLLKDGNEKNVG